MSNRNRTRAGLGLVAMAFSLFVAAPAWAQYGPPPSPAPNIPTIVINTPGATITISGTNFCPPGQANQGNCTSTGNPPPVRITRNNNNAGGPNQLEVAQPVVDRNGNFEISVPRSAIAPTGATGAVALRILGVGRDGTTYAGDVGVPQPNSGQVVAPLRRTMDAAGGAAEEIVREAAPALPTVMTDATSPGLTVTALLLIVALLIANGVVWVSRRRSASGA